MTYSISRRTALIGGALASTSLAFGKAALAQDKSMRKMERPMLHMAKARGFKIGKFQVTALLAGSIPRPEPHKIFGLNVSAEDFKAASDANFIPSNSAQFFFTPTVVDTGEAIILFDTGLNAAGITAALSEAGYAPTDITHVVITHMHGDHIGGLMNEGAPTFSNVAYLTGQVEFDHWAKGSSKRFDSNMRPLAEKTSFVKDGSDIVSGITAMAAFGHTPGHMTYHIESEGQRLLLMADLANHYVWSLAYPDWEVKFDMDKTAAAQSRRKVLGMVATDRIPILGYHMPFPAVGYVETRDQGFRYVPASYQLMG
ncbi:MBL fold metallo-hydrolase [Cohaesibacter gelatinilyticus]|uniref:Glyoxylase, beta-lactamase superfamily II n=1 Tax=Cohaesibacter gelatinilyticus TaxID=372072 RepID=A0A285PNU1_9HYPH|nr:MBL fold metallo-hydrolase [Cohaesibacter gelatinilyticus]SNZ21581.1 Glyoxylase, beta-lactamase superfamily II [Cohaesibacter gelatinilyticus]